MTAEATERKTAEFIRKQHMADRGDGILAAVSGGADSVCLLLILWELRERLGIRLAAFHLNHGLRGAEADRDEAFVKRLCGEYGIPLTAVRENIREYAAARGLTEEEAGRERRYALLEETAARHGLERIATAHHRDDCAETVLMNLLRGSGLKGLAGIPAARGKVIRPLLCLTRAEIEAYLAARGVAWCEDSTNQESIHTRNRVRNELLPWIRETVNPRAAEHLLRTAALAGEADAYFEALADEILGKAQTASGLSASPINTAGSSTPASASSVERVISTLASASGAERVISTPATVPGAERVISIPMPTSGAELVISLPTAVFDVQPDIVKSYLVRAMLARTEAGKKNISERHVRAVLALRGPGAGTRADLPGGLCFCRDYHTLTLRQERPKPDAAAPLSPLCADAAVSLPSLRMRVFSWKKDAEIPKTRYTKWLDYDKIKCTPVCRTRREGDYFLLPGGKKKSLRRYFIDEKIPEAARGRIPLLAAGSHILWIIGYRLSDGCKLDAATQTVVEVTAEPGEGSGGCGSPAGGRLRANIENTDNKGENHG